MERITTDDLVIKLRDAGLTKAEAEHLLSTLLDTVKTAMIAGDEVYLKGFGKFVPTHRPERHRNIFGEVRKIRERRGVKFRPFTAFLESMNT